MEDNRTSKGLGVRARRIIAYIVLIVISFFCLFWFYVLFVNSTRSNAAISSGFTIKLGSYFYTNMYNAMHSTLPIVYGLRNSFIVAAGNAALCVYFSAMTAFGIHAYRFKGRKAIATFILMIMMIPTQVTILGFIKLVNALDMENTFWPLILPAIAAPVVYFFMKQYLESNLPMSLIEAARIDGAHEFRIFNTVVIPIIKPALAVQAIFAFVASWNNYFVPSHIIDKSKMKTLPILVAELRSADFLNFDMGQVYAMILFSIFPVIIVYLLLSRYIIEGVGAGAVKG